ncbi:MAG: hypothetical protein JNM17_20370 [Archangium sp.]|nr:hypothetical protein [Archangium sp.]
MSELSPQARAALRALGSPEPTAADERRVREGFERAVGVVLPAAAVVGAVTVGSSAAAATGASTAAMSAGGASGATVASFTALGTGAKVMLFVAAVGVGSVVTAGAKAVVVSKPAAVALAASTAKSAQSSRGNRTQPAAANQPEQIAPCTPGQLAAGQVDPCPATQVAPCTPGQVDPCPAPQVAPCTPGQLAAGQVDPCPAQVAPCTPGQLAAGQVDPCPTAQVAPCTPGQLAAGQVDPCPTAQVALVDAPTGATLAARGPQPVTPVSSAPKLSRKLIGAAEPEVTPDPVVAVAPTPSKLSDTPELVPPPTPAAAPTPQSATTEAGFELVVEAHFPSCDSATELRTALAARKLLVDQRAEHALFLIGAYQKHCPSGQWSDEAWRVRLSSLCAIGRDTEAASLFEWFATEYPHRRFAIESELRSSCEPSVLGKE